VVVGIGAQAENGAGTPNSSGDLILADYDGVVVVPHQIAVEVIGAAEEKLAGESHVREKLATGMPTWEAFQTYGII
jgi:4-hydroxy-4-methyl-2-oxoglutarate aldolase